MKNQSGLNYFLTVLITALLLATTSAHAAETTRVSVSSTGEEVTDTRTSSFSAISADGRYVAFSSGANKLVAGDTNGADDAFVHDRLTGETTRVSVNSAGAQGNSYSYLSAISADGRYVAFTSIATNLVAGDTNGTDDAFVHDRVTGKTTRVSVSSAGVQGNSYSYPSAISADGRYVAFSSAADNLVAKDTNGGVDVFVHDRVTDDTIRVSVSSAGTQAISPWLWLTYTSATISADGRYVAFSSTANNLVEENTSIGTGIPNVYVHDCVTGETTLVSVSSTGERGNGQSYPATAISADGRYVAFHSEASNLVTGDMNGGFDAFVHDRVTGDTIRISVSSLGGQVDGYNWPTAISADGRYVVFTSRANTFVHDRVTGKTTRVSVSSTGEHGNGFVDLYSSAISADGRYVTFSSSSSNLVLGDTNGAVDVFVRDRWLNDTKAADLRVAVTGQPASVQKGQTASYMLTVTNGGPDSVGTVALTDIISNGAVTEMTSSKGSCSKAAVSVCRFGRLAAGVSATVTVKIKANANPLKQQVSVNAPPKDNAPGNNVITVSTPVTP